MNWADKRERVFELFGKALIEEPCLELPVIEQKVGTQYDLLDNLIYDALLEEDLPSLPVVDPRIVQWIDQVEEYEEKQLKLVSDAQQEQEREEEKTVQVIKVNKGQQNQLQPTKCDLCNKDFQFPVNAERHKWRHRHKTVEKTIASSRDQFRGYWEKLEDEKARKIISIKDAVLPVNLAELQVNAMLEAVGSYVEELDKESRCLEHNSLVAFLLKPEGTDECPPFQVILKALLFLSDGNFLRGTLDLEMQQIVFPHAITMAKIEEQGLLASFGFLVEYCMMKAWADDRKRNADLLLEEEEAAKKQALSTPSPSKASKPSSSKRRKERKRKVSEKQTEDEGKHDSSKDKEGHDNSSRPNQDNSKESEKNTAEKSSEQNEQDSSNAAATQSNPVQSVHDSVRDINYDPNSEDGSAKDIDPPNSGPTFDDGGSLRSQPGTPILEKSEDTQLNSKAKEGKAKAKKKGKVWKPIKKQNEYKGKHDSSKDKEEHDSSARANQGGSKEREKNTADKSSEHNKQDNSEFEGTSSQTVEETQGPKGTETPETTSSQPDEETKIPDCATRRVNLREVFKFDKSFSDYVRYLRQRWRDFLTSPDCIELEEYERLVFTDRP